MIKGGRTMDALKKQMSKMRREFHQIAEPGWLEFQTTVKLIDYLKSYGYEVEYGKFIHSERWATYMKRK